ncbi:MAG: GNAT family N-acetyltransferase [Rickettsiales bacterium]|jgi:ribosomal-protein-alanine N-acetyltransferase|nr:GNAT family N-acetyltransferase [Rickettsiales bacterium]
MIEQLAEIHKSAFGNKSWTADEILRLKQSGAEVFGSENAMIIYRAAADEAEILTIAVRPEHRRTGLASALLKMMETELAKQNIKKIFLEVSEMNKPAIALYKYANFVQVAIRPEYYQGVDALLMQKEL